jgi:hypothetical protein
MVDLDLLARRAQRSAEIGRLRVAVRILPVIAIACVIACAANRTFTLSGVALSCALLAAVVASRFAGRREGAAALSGVLAAAAPAIALVVLRGVCGPSASDECGTGCAAVGFVAGAVIALAHYREFTEQPRAWVAFAVTATLSTALGCAALGAGAVVAVLVTLTAGAIAASALRRVGAV